MWKIVAEIEGVAIKENIDHHMGFKLGIEFDYKNLTNLKKRRKKSSTKSPKSL
jgi:hypothetical protein